MNNRPQNRLKIVLLVSISISLSSCAPKSCASAQSDYENAQKEYARLGQELTQQVTDRYGETIRGAEITQVSNELYVKSKSAADRVAVAQIEYQEACKSTPINKDITFPSDSHTSNKSEERKEVSVVESTDLFSTLPPEELAAKNNIIEREKQRTDRCVAKMESGEIEAYNSCVK